MYANLVPRVLKLFGHRVLARRDSGELEKTKYFVWLPRNACIVLQVKSYGNWNFSSPESLLLTSPYVNARLY